MSLVGGPPPPPPNVSVSRVWISETIIMRVPIIRPHFAWPIEWVEKRGPRCIRPAGILAAALADDGSVDFLMRNRQRVRAKLENSCPSLDLYGGLYLQPDGDRLCAGRDEVRSRIGGSCAIDEFKLMVAHPVR
jgi:hypothetical protein